MKCFYCGKVIEKNDSKIIIALDKPYINLWVHKECEIEIYNYGVNKYLNENKERIFKILETETPKKENIKRKL